MTTIKPILRALVAAGFIIPLPLAAQLQLQTSALPSGYLTKAYPATQLYAEGGTAPYSFTLTGGTLPAGLVFSSPAGILSGTPTGAPGAPSLSFQVSDGAGGTATRSLTLAVKFPPLPPVWTAKGQYGGRISRIAASPNYPLDGMLFATGTEGEIQRSPDRGLSWSRVVPDPANVGGGEITGLVLSPNFNAGGATATEKTLYVSSVGMAVYRSIDGGLTYTAANTGLPCKSAVCTWGEPSVTALAISPGFVTDARLWALALNISSGYDVYRTQNGGGNWTMISTIPYCSGLNLQRIQASPDFAADNTLFVHSCNTLYRSTLGGASNTWMPIYTDPNLSSNGFVNLVISPDFATDRTLVIENKYHEFYRSHDGGATFTKVPMTGVRLSVARRAGRSPAWYFARVPPQGLPVPPPYQLARSDDGMRTTTPIFGDGYPAPSDDFQIGAVTGAAAATGAEPDLFYGLYHGLYGSFDNGETFSSRDKGLNGYLNYAVAGAGDFVVSCANGAWFLSADGGVSWARQPLPGGAVSCNVVGVSPDHAADQTLFLGMNNTTGLYRTGDGGQSFTQVFSGSPVLTIAFVPGFAGGNGTVYIGANNGLHRSVDGGRNFTAVTLPADCTNAYVVGLAVSPNFGSDSTIFAAQAFGGAVGGLCRSTDGGATWVSMQNGVNRIVGPLALSPVYNNGGTDGSAQKTLMMFDTSTNRILRSNNGGSTWTISTFPAGYYRGEVRFSPNFATDRTVLFFCGGSIFSNLTSFGVYRSSDDGATFTALGAADELKTHNVSGIYLLPAFNGAAVTGSPAVAVGIGSGVWRSNDGARAFSPVTAYSTLSYLVRGMTRAANGTLYVASANAGVYRSTDNGALFARYADGLPANANVSAIIAAPATPLNPVAAVANLGLWRLTGATWTQLAAHASGSFVSFHDDGVNLYAARADGSSLRSTDGGASWTGLQPSQADLVALDYNPALTLTDERESAARTRTPAPKSPAGSSAPLWSVSLSGGPRWSADSGSIWTATPGTNDYLLPGGQTWKVIKAQGINALSGAREIVAGSTTGLWRSLDGGDTWRPVDGAGSGLEATSRNFAAVLSTTTAYGGTDLLVGAAGSTTGGIYLSGDGGEHWTQVNQGFDPGSLSISSLVKTSCSGCPVQYYSGSYGSGVYTRTITVNAPPTFPGANRYCFGPACTGSANDCADGASSGPISGGQAFKLCGAGFQAGAAVEFDSVPAAGCVTHNANVITCATPPHAAGLATIRVRNPDTRAGTLQPQYTYSGGSSRGGNTLRVAKGGGNADLSWTCSPACTAGDPARIYRGQNAVLTLYPENYNGGLGSTYSNLGAVSTNYSYFWSVE